MKAADSDRMKRKAYEKELGMTESSLAQIKLTPRLEVTSD
jgi:hypothetical protein